MGGKGATAEGEQHLCPLPFQQVGSTPFHLVIYQLPFGLVRAASKVEQVTEKPLVGLVCKRRGHILLISDFSSTLHLTSTDTLFFKDRERNCNIYYFHRFEY